MGGLCTIPAKLDAEHTEDGVKPIAVTDNKCTIACIYRGKLMFQLYEIKEQETFKKKDTVHLRRELIANGVNNFDFTPGRDSVNRLKLVGEEKVTHLKIYMTVHGEEFVANVKLLDNVSELVSVPKYSDMPIF